MANNVDQEKSNELDDGEHYLQSSNDIPSGEVILGTLVGVDEQGKALVTFAESGSSEPVKAIATITVLPKHFGRQAALLFANGSIQEPIIVGLLHNPLLDMLSNVSFVDTTDNEDESTLDNDTADQEHILPKDASVDGNRVVIEGKQEVVLKCGHASITLTEAGKILIRGKYLLSRSSGVNRIMGGSVQVN